MLLGETIAVALQSIRANMLRSVLTMLGIIIGVGAVITMVALGSGAQKAVQDRIAALGANVFTVFAGQASQGGIRITDRTILSTDDYDALRRDATLLKAVVPGDAAGPAGEVRQPEQQRERRRHHRQLHRRPELHRPVRPDVHRTARTRPGSGMPCWGPRCPGCWAATRPG